MTNIRINKLALELNIQNDQVMEELQKLKIQAKNYMSAIDEDAANQIRDIFSNIKEVKLKKTGIKTKKVSTPKVAKKATLATTKSTAKKKSAPKKPKTTEEPPSKNSPKDPLRLMAGSGLQSLRPTQTQKWPQST